MKNPTRRDLAAATAFSLVPRHVLGKGHTPPSDKLVIAGIGVGGVGKSYLKGVNTENIAFLCDVDDMLAIALAALGRRKHIYCAKPLTRTIAECRAVGRAARDAGVATQMSVQSGGSDKGCLHRRVGTLGRHRQGAGSSRVEQPPGFEFGTRLTGLTLLGDLAVRTGKPLRWDAATGSTGDPEADRYLEEPARPGWG